ncbi:hypothetical protein DNG35_08735 [Mesonia sp. K7]|nr:hypothetical protein DNG35_08735 [Mesonia sp. K7]
MRIDKKHISFVVAVAFISVQLTTAIHYVWTTHHHVIGIAKYKVEIQPDTSIADHHCEYFHIKFYESFLPKEMYSSLFIDLIWVYQHSNYHKPFQPRQIKAFDNRGPPQFPIT